MGKEIIKKAFALEQTERTPWVPFVGVHAASLIGVTAEEYLKNGDLIVKGVSKAIETYNPDGIPVVFDLQLEAESMGCSLVWANDNPPSVSSHPLTDGVELEDIKMPSKDDVRIAEVLKATRELRAKYPDIALYGLITGPFTLALHLMGTDVFMKMFMDEAYVKEVLSFCVKVCDKMTDMYVEAGCDIIAVVDPMTSQISPDSFRQFVTEPATEVFSHIRSAGVNSSFFVCGHAKHNIEVMCECKPDNISIDENIPLDYVRDICISKGISYGGNMKLTVVLLMGSELDAERNAVECMDIGANKGFILAPGCDLAYATPKENILAAANIVNDTYRQDVVRAMESTSMDVESIDKAVYGSSDKVIVDIITLDSLGCAPCQYMVQAVVEAVGPLGSDVVWNEWKVKTKEGLGFMAALGVSNIPTICIDGEIAFVSQIPPVSQIREAVENRLNTKKK